MTKENKEQKVKKENKQSSKENAKKSVIIGVGLLLVVLSIAYSSSVIVIGTESYIPKILLIPQVVWAASVAVKQFTK